MRELTIAVDGPASAGKGTLARAVARALGYQYVDTGAMYRAVALVAERRGVEWENGPAVAAVARDIQLRFVWDGDVLRVLVDEEDLTRAIRDDDIGTGASLVSTHPSVRAALLDMQRALGAEGGVVMDGRDIGTVVLPRADVKIFLDAGVDERARRRHEELLRRGETSSFDAVRQRIIDRDRQDRERNTAPLVQAEDAVYLDTTELSPRQAAERVLSLVAQKRR